MKIRFEEWFVTLSLLYFGGGLFPKRAEEGMKLGDDSGKHVVIQLMIFSLLCVFAFLHRQRIWRRTCSTQMIWFVCIPCLFSTMWSLDSTFTLRRSGVLLLTSLFALFFAECFDQDTQHKIFLRVITIELLGSAAVALMFPDYGVSQLLHQGAWRGMFSHKNFLGRLSGIAIIFLLSARPLKHRCVAKYSLLLLAIVELLLTRSATAILSTVVVILAYPFLNVLRVRKRGVIPLWFCVFPVLAMAAFSLLAFPGMLLDVLGKDATMTGRIPLWAAVVRELGPRMWFGYGYAAFWGTINPYVAIVHSDVGWLAPHAHNGFIDIALDVGLIGLAGFIFAMLKPLSQALQLYRRGSPEAAWPLLAILFILCFNVTESMLLIIPSFLWLLLIWITVNLEKTLDAQWQMEVDASAQIGSLRLTTMQETTASRSIA